MIFFKLKPYYLLFSMVLLSYSCGNGAGKKEEATDSANTTADEQTIEDDYAKPLTALDASEPLYSWVDNLNIRKEPNTKAEVVARAQIDGPLAYTGEKTDHIETIVLRAVAYEEPWLKVKTEDGKEGWVFGGAVKRKDQNKGNSEITSENFNFPYFGNFDLSTWTKTDTKTEGEEVDYVITTYKQDGRTLEVTSADRGEFYYGYTYKLFDSKNNLLKERDFSFSVDADLRELTETVKDYLADPPKEYTRQQNISKHFYDLNARPEMVNGVWSTKRLETTGATTNE